MTPTRRGLYEFGDIFLRWRLQLGLLIRQMRVKARSAVKVYPNVASLARYELAAMRHRTTEVGLAPARLRGRGSMFESLRDYVPGDDPADAAWKATARHGRLMTRNFETERSQNILVVLDCGRLMVPAGRSAFPSRSRHQRLAAVELRGDEAGRLYRAGRPSATGWSPTFRRSRAKRPWRG